MKPFQFFLAFFSQFIFLKWDKGWPFKQADVFPARPSKGPTPAWRFQVLTRTSPPSSPFDPSLRRQEPCSISLVLWLKSLLFYCPHLIMFKLFYENTCVNFIAMKLKSMVLNCMNYIYVCGNFISMELNLFLIFDRFHIRSTLYLLKWLKHFVLKYKIHKVLILYINHA
jgi:hypothetical protein